MSKSKEKLFTFDIEQGDDGIHIKLGGEFGKSLQAMKAFCEQYCACVPCCGGKPGDE